MEEFGHGLPGSVGGKGANGWDEWEHELKLTEPHVPIFSQSTRPNLIIITIIGQIH